MNTARFRPAITALLLLVALSGCALLPASRSIGYSRSGGFAGFADELVIAPDGSAVLTDRGRESRFTVSPETLAALDAAFAASGFRGLEGSTPPPGSADMFTFTFTWRGHTLHTTEVPAALEPAAAILAELVEDHRPG